MVRRFVLLALTMAAGCGRSSLMGHSPYDCPPSQLNSNGTCGPQGDMRPHDMGDMGDMSDMGFCPDFCVGFCGDPQCCSCTFCQFDPMCGPDMGDMKGRDMGDMSGDLCANPNNCTLPQCAGDPRCHMLGTEICNNGIDDDNDGLVDCKDPDCADFPGCQPHMCNDAMPDCTDPACVTNPKCIDLKCMPTVDFGTINPTGSSSTKMENTTGTTDVTVTPCGPGGAGMVVGKFVLSGTADVVLSFTQSTGEDHVFGLFAAGVNQTCGANPVACYDPKSATMGTHTFQSLAPGEYYLISQPFEKAGQGPLSVTLSTATQMEICNNGIDDNGNGLIDCADSECVTAPNCINNECMPDFNVGALVVNAPGKSVSFDTTGATPNNNLTCEGAKGGGDVVVQFTLKQTAGILLNWDQLGDHVVGLMNAPNPGQPCDANQLSCYDPSGRTSDEVTWDNMPAGTYDFIFKALKPGDEGHIDATISAYTDRPQELCHNGIDDDGNGLIDCADPACVGVAGCSAPFCQPDVQLGQMSVGDQQTVNLNIQQNGQLGYKTSCSRGGGKGMVVQLTVPSAGGSGGVGLGFECSETGDQVLDLFAAGGPRDTCDVNEMVCADPKTLPFGCGYEIPNLQPGTYNVIVQGFESGTEGTMQLTLSVLDDRQLEICNNNIDDDGNGLTDCNDPKCFTSQYCTKSQCRPDKSINPMPLTGTQVFELMQTSGNGQHGGAGCATTPGGQSAVIGITLTAAADLQLQWFQVGNHDFALYTDEGQQAPCDAGTQLQCQKGGGANQSGMTTWTNIPEGNYWLVVAADGPDGTTTNSGSAEVVLSGMPHM
jgi:hypothetical protein